MISNHWQQIQDKIKNHFKTERIVFVPSILPLTEVESNDDIDPFWIRISTYWNGELKNEGETRAYPYNSGEDALYALVENFAPELVKIAENDNKIANKVIVVIWRIFPEIAEYKGKFAARMRLGIGRI